MSQVQCLLGSIAAAGTCSCVVACLDFVCTQNAIVGMVCAEDVKLVMDSGGVFLIILPLVHLEIQLLNRTLPTPLSHHHSPCSLTVHLRSR